MVSGAGPADGRRLRASLAASCAEGMVAEAFAACVGGVALTAWALALGAPAVVIGLLSALPLAAQTLQLPAAWITHTFGYRRVAVLAIAASRLSWLPLGLLPLLALDREATLTLFVVVVAAGSLFGVIGNNAWTAWMADLVPEAIRGRFFSHRTIHLSMAGTAATLAVALVLELADDHRSRIPALSLLAAVGCLAAVVSVWLLLRQHDPSDKHPRTRFSWAALAEPFADRRVRPFLYYQTAWNAAVGVAAGFFSYHLLSNLEAGFVIAAAHGIAVAAVRVAAASWWGRAVDRFGGRPVLQLCSLGIALIPALWLFATPRRLWPIAIEAVVAGALWSGHGIAAMDLTLTLAPRPRRAAYVAAFAAAGGMGFAIASLLAGILADHLPPRFTLGAWPLTNVHVLLALSAVARLAAGSLVAGIEERNARTAGDLLRAISSGLWAAWGRRRTAILPAPLRFGRH